MRLAAEAEARKRLAEAEEAGTRKGRSFEERVHDAIERIAAGRGDAAHHVGDERGAGGTKKGDTVVEIGACDGPAVGRMVFESKDEQLSKNRAWEELNGAMTERDAVFAVLAVAGEEEIPAGREQLVEYEGNKMIVVVDPELPDELGLDLVYRYARLRVLIKGRSGADPRRGGRARRGRGGALRAQAGAGDPPGAQRRRQELTKGAGGPGHDGRRRSGEARTGRVAGRRPRCAPIALRAPPSLGPGRRLLYWRKPGR